jgi:hypothetical protein
VALVGGLPWVVACETKTVAVEFVRADLERRLSSLEERARALLVT